MKITIVSAVHGRKYLWGLFSKGVHNLCEAFQKKGYNTSVVISCTNEMESEYFLKQGFITIQYGNEWLGKKWNEAIEYAWMDDADYVMMIGSDDIVSPKIVDLYDPLIKQGQDIFGMKGMYVLDLEKDVLKEFRGYPKNFRLSIGAGKMISSKALKKVHGRPALEQINRGLDTSIIVNLRRFGYEDYLVDDGKLYIIDLKTKHNLNKFDALLGREYTPDYIKLKDIFHLTIKLD